MRLYNHIISVFRCIGERLSASSVRFIGLYSILAFLELVILRLYGFWHLSFLFCLFVLLLSQTLSIKQRYLSIVSSVHILITICIAAYDLGGFPQSDMELSFVQYCRIIDGFVVITAIYTLYQHLNLRLKIGWKRLILISSIPLTFIIFLFDVFSFQLQVILIIRISQLALISCYVLFVRKPIHWAFSVWVLFLTLLGVFGALRLSGIFGKGSLFFEDFFEIFSFLFFIIGLKETIKNFKLNPKLKML